jgi:hypothetical protein
MAQNVFYQRLLGFNEHFTVGDKLIAAGLLAWSLLLVVITALVAAWNIIPGGRWPIAWWSNYWLVFGIWVPLVVGTFTFVWFTIGGVRDMRDFFRALKTLTRDATDNGRVEPLAEPHGFPLEASPLARAPLVVATPLAIDAAAASAAQSTPPPASAKQRPSSLP